MNWQEFPDAPDVGARICGEDDLPDAGILSLNIGDLPVLVVTGDMGVRVFVNACPHQFLPLDQRGETLSADCRRLVCSNHDAVFDAVTGNGIGGFGEGCALSLIPAKIENKQLVIA